MAWYSRRNNPVADLPKDGIESVGMACGQSGKKANYKASVFAAYLGLGSAVLVARPLYLPQSWGWGKSHADWHRRTGVSASTSPRAKPRLALDMLSDLVSEGWLPVRWVTCDEGISVSHAFLDGVATLALDYLAGVTCNTHVWTARPELAGPLVPCLFSPLAGGGCRGRRAPGRSLAARRPVGGGQGPLVPFQVWNQYQRD